MKKVLFVIVTLALALTALEAAAAPPSVSHLLGQATQAVVPQVVNPTYEVVDYEPGGFTCKRNGTPPLPDALMHDFDIENRINSFRLRPHPVAQPVPRAVVPTIQTGAPCGARLGPPT